MRGGDRAGERGDRLDPEDEQEVSSASERLSLRVADDDDLAVLASVLQDAVIAIGDIRYIASEKLFVMLASRFRWEAIFDSESEGAAGDAVFERIHCGIAFEGVEAVQVRGIDLKDRSQYLDLLTLRARKGAIVLTFAGGAAIRLDVPHISCHMRDMGEPWPTANRPEHGLSEGG
jgi:Protein of unknown function (DUF2948)